jgi:hypothetical protein
MCRRRLAHEFASGSKPSKLGDAAFEVSNRLIADAVTWHRGDVVREHGFPDPNDLEPEQRAVYRAAARTYLRRFGHARVDVHDLGWSTDMPEIGVRLVGPAGIATTDDAGGHELRILRLSARRIDSIDIRFLILRASAWATDSLRIVSVDLIDDDTSEYDIDIAAKLPEASEWLAARVEIIRARVHPRHTSAGADCRDCPCIPGCPQVTRVM